MNQNIRSLFFAHLLVFVSCQAVADQGEIEPSDMLNDEANILEVEKLSLDDITASLVSQETPTDTDPGEMLAKNLIPNISQIVAQSFGQFGVLSTLFPALTTLLSWGTGIPLQLLGAALDPQPEASRIVLVSSNEHNTLPKNAKTEKFWFSRTPRQSLDKFSQIFEVVDPYHRNQYILPFDNPVNYDKRMNQALSQLPVDFGEQLFTNQIIEKAGQTWDPTQQLQKTRKPMSESGSDMLGKSIFLHDLTDFSMLARLFADPTGMINTGTEKDSIAVPNLVPVTTKNIVLPQGLNVESNIQKVLESGSALIGHVFVKDNNAGLKKLQNVQHWWEPMYSSDSSSMTTQPSEISEVRVKADVLFKKPTVSDKMFKTAIKADEQKKTSKKLKPALWFRLPNQLFRTTYNNNINYKDKKSSENLKLKDKLIDFKRQVFNELKMLPAVEQLAEKFHGSSEGITIRSIKESPYNLLFHLKPEHKITRLDIEKPLNDIYDKKILIGATQRQSLIDKLPYPSSKGKISVVGEETLNKYRQVEPTILKGVDMTKMPHKRQLSEILNKIPNLNKKKSTVKKVIECNQSKQRQLTNSLNDFHSRDDFHIKINTPLLDKQCIALRSEIKPQNYQTQSVVSKRQPFNFKKQNENIRRTSFSIDQPKQQANPEFSNLFLSSQMQKIDSLMNMPALNQQRHWGNSQMKIPDSDQQRQWISSFNEPKPESQIKILHLNPQNQWLGSEVELPYILQHRERTNYKTNKPHTNSRTQMVDPERNIYSERPQQDQWCSYQKKIILNQNHNKQRLNSPIDQTKIKPMDSNSQSQEFLNRLRNIKANRYISQYGCIRNDKKFDSFHIDDGYNFGNGRATVAGGYGSNDLKDADGYINTMDDNKISASRWGHEASANKDSEAINKVSIDLTDQNQPELVKLHLRFPILTADATHCPKDKEIKVTFKKPLQQKHIKRLAINVRFNNVTDILPSQLEQSRVKRQKRNVNYGTLQRIDEHLLNSLRKQYKDSLKEITLKPDENTADALKRYNLDFIQDALERASQEPVELSGDKTVPDVIYNSDFNFNPHDQKYYAKVIQTAPADLAQKCHSFYINRVPSTNFHSYQLNSIPEENLGCVYTNPKAHSFNSSNSFRTKYLPYEVFECLENNSYAQKLMPISKISHTSENANIIPTNISFVSPKFCYNSSDFNALLKNINESLNKCCIKGKELLSLKKNRISKHCAKKNADEIRKRSLLKEIKTGKKSSVGGILNPEHKEWLSELVAKDYTFKELTTALQTEYMGDKQLNVSAGMKKEFEAKSKYISPVNSFEIAQDKSRKRNAINLNVLLKSNTKSSEDNSKFQEADNVYKKKTPEVLIKNKISSNVIYNSNVRMVREQVLAVNKELTHFMKDTSDTTLRPYELRGKFKPRNISSNRKHRDVFKHDETDATAGGFAEQKTHMKNVLKNYKELSCLTQ